MTPAKERIVIVTGARDLIEQGLVFEALDVLQPTRVVQGGADGADYLARKWAVLNDVACTTVRAKWERYGAVAGPIRNEKMLRMYPDALCVLAFPRGGPGTNNCIEQARSFGMPVEVL